MADLYISASHVDGSSVSLMEALACGLPCLVSDIPANREWVTDGENGWLFPDGDAEALAARILQAIDRKYELYEMGLSARQLAESRADWNKNFPLLLFAYQSAINNRKSR
jgi:glycosyltransferase involved in cell wall biosynthesis